MTSISPFVVTSDALLPFAVASRERAAGDPQPLPYLSDKDNLASGALDITLDAYMVTKRMRDAGEAPAGVTRTNFKHMYWNFAQMLTHHASNGCSLQPGDILGCGTTSGPTDGSRACMAEISSRGSKPFNLPNSESRTYLVDGDKVIFRGRAERDGAVGIGYGECCGIVLPAVAWPSAWRGSAMASPNINPVLRLAMTLRVNCTAFEAVGDMGKGVRRVQTLTGGTFSRPSVKGIVLGGYDWQIAAQRSLC